MSAHTDVCTILYRSREDTDILTRKLFDVNMLLFKSCVDYRRIVLDCCLHIRMCAMSQREGYKKPHGFSGANAGIPLNIIALADGTVMINPHIGEVNGERIAESNCGSLMLPNPIMVRRHAYIEVRYFDEQGEPHVMTGYLPTVQHEVDHNNGVLITDRKAEQ